MTHRSNSFDVAVIGGGVIGLAVGWRASQRGARVVVLERAEPGRATSWVAAGMLAPVTEAALAEQPLLHLGVASAEAYPAFVAEIRDESGLDPGYLRCGTLVAARDPDEAEALERELAMRSSLGLTVRRIRSSEARRIEPGLAPTLRLALEVPDDHAVDPRRLTSALAAALRHRGGELRSGAAVRELLIPGDRVERVVLDDGERLMADHVVVAAGVWSSQLGGIPTHARVPVHPVKGQILRMHDPQGPGLLTRVLRMSGGYLVPRGDGRYVLGATMEERGFDTTVTAGAAFELLRGATELVPGISELVIDEFSAGLRPGTPDNAPVIGAGVLDGLYWATGHYRNGVLLAPITADILAAVLTGDDHPAAAPELAPSRFTRTPVGA